MMWPAQLSRLPTVKTAYRVVDRALKPPQPSTGTRMPKEGMHGKRNRHKCTAAKRRLDGSKGNVSIRLLHELRQKAIGMPKEALSAVLIEVIIDGQQRRAIRTPQIRSLQAEQYWVCWDFVV